MNLSKTFLAFSPDEYQKACHLLATKVALMMGRKFEENDWTEVYCLAKAIPSQKWSNLNIDIMHNGLGIEHKMMRIIATKSLASVCGTRLMHPSATRSIRIPSLEQDPNEVMRDILFQYGELIESRKNTLSEKYPNHVPDMRVGWLLWQSTLEEFIYFEEALSPPNPDDYYAAWVERKNRGGRKKSKNLWVYEKETGYKRYSITTEAGAKIQPYFDIPSLSDPHLFIFRVQGEPLTDNLVRLWVMPSTHAELQRQLGEITPENLSSHILKIAQLDFDAVEGYALDSELAVPINLTLEAYHILKQKFKGISDEHLIQLFVKSLRSINT